MISTLNDFETLCNVSRQVKEDVLFSLTNQNIIQNDLQIPSREMFTRCYLMLSLVNLRRFQNNIK